MSNHTATSSGFTLIEMLVVISLIGILAGLLLTNFVGVRERAADSSLKNDLRQLKTALRLYYNDHGHYPDHASGVLQGCGASGDAACTTTTFTAGTTVYMNSLPEDVSYYSDAVDAFLLVTVLSNLSDEDIAASETKCNPSGRSYYGVANPPVGSYFVCED